MLENLGITSIPNFGLQCSSYYFCVNLDISSTYLLKSFQWPCSFEKPSRTSEELVIKGTPYELTIETAVLADQITKRLSSIHQLIELGLGLQAKLLGHDFESRLQNRLLPILKLIAKLAKLDHNSKGFTLKTSVKLRCIIAP